MSRKKKNLKINWQEAPDVKKRVKFLTKTLDLDWLKEERITFFRSTNSSARAYARIWGLSKVWQLALGTQAHYIIEVLSEKFDSLSNAEKDKVLLHEITHIPKNFSGSLLPHIRRRGKRNFHDRVERLFSHYLKKIK